MDKGIITQINWYIYGFVMITYGIVLVSSFSYFLIKNSKRRKRIKIAILEGISSDKIDNYSKLRITYIGIFQKEFSGKSVSNLSRILKELFADLVLQKDNTNTGVLTKLEGYINEIDQISPFSELPDLERNILVDLQNATNSIKSDYITDKLKEISNIIQTRFENLEKTKKINKRAIILAVIGAVLTTFFGIVTLIYQA